MHGRLASWSTWSACDIGEAAEGLKNELWRKWSDEPHSTILSRLTTSQLILQPFHCFIYVTAHSPTLPPLYLRHSSFSNSSVASPTSQLILQPFFRFSYVTSSSLNSPGEPPMIINCIKFLHLRSWSFLSVVEIGEVIFNSSYEIFALL